MHSQLPHQTDTCGQPHSVATLPPVERAPDTHWIGGWVGSRASMDAAQKTEKSLLLPVIEIGCPACSPVQHSTRCGK